MTRIRIINEFEGQPTTTPVLDDSQLSFWTDEPVRNDAEAARYWAAKYGEALSLIQDLRSDLSAARFERDVGGVFMFCVGVLCGAGLVWWFLV